jgi:hypothetical protein
MKRARDFRLQATSRNSIAPVSILNEPGHSRCSFWTIRGIGSILEIPNRIAVRTLIAVGVFLTISFSSSVSEVQTSTGTPFPSPNNSVGLPQSPFPDPFHGMDEISQRQFQLRLKELNLQRQKQLTSDSVKLLALANELKADVDKGGSDAPTPEQARKAEQIEKLARSVRDKMKAVDSPVPTMQPIRRK